MPGLPANNALEKVVRTKNAEIERRDAIMERQTQALAEQAKYVAAQKKELDGRALNASAISSDQIPFLRAHIARVHRGQG